VNSRSAHLQQTSDSADCLFTRQSRQKLSRSFTEFGMARLRRNLDQRLENKSALVHCRMRNPQAWLIHHAIREKHNVDINVARTFLAHAETSHGRFDLQCKLEQLPRRLIRFNRRDAVQKPRLVWDVYRLGLIQGGNLQQPARNFQLCDGRAQVGRTVSQVRSQRQICDFTHPASFAANAARIQQKLTAGIIYIFPAS